MFELGYCFLLLLLCEMRYSVTLNWYEYDVLSRSRQVLILSHWLNIVAVMVRPTLNWYEYDVLSRSRQNSNSFILAEYSSSYF